MINLLIIANLICPAPILNNINLQDSLDKEVHERAVYVCKTKYKGCLKSLTKTGPLSFRVICYTK